MITKFSYEVKVRNEELGTMEVEFYAEGFEPVLVGTLIPLEGEDEATFLATYAPHSVWDSVVRKTETKSLLPVGTRGFVNLETLGKAPEFQSEVEPLPTLGINKITL
jgi:hypothetical protein